MPGCSAGFWDTRDGKQAKAAIVTSSALTVAAAVGLGFLLVIDPQALVTLVDALGGPGGVVGTVLGADILGGAFAAGVTACVIEDNPSAQRLLGSNP